MNHHQPTEQDPFDDLLGLEDDYYREGHALGVADGSRAGRIEGRVFGLEKGFEKFVAMGTLHGKAAVWGARLPSKDGESLEPPVLPVLATNPRLEKHIQTLYALAEPESLSTQNDEDSVSEFDDRLKRAAAKEKVIEALIREGGDGSKVKNTTSRGPASTQRGVKMSGLEKAERNMEDFGNPPRRS
ncbi:DUF1715-domain-containing protein [Saccharata proteae CBS 121410]|uniref:DUF1715-domain-containing protein n=1 Tax=Saccharata proteae CBS 121410 TaxID=1314787 RepID=A0A9P4LXK0_9PEZI|nr:DUF1715-domain-containing protein [Saccharata proteae CBS 121410]